METLQQLKTTFVQRMEAFESELKKGNPSSPNITTLAADFASFKTFVMDALRTFQEQTALLTLTVDQLEMRSRRKILLFHGVPEGKQEDTCSLVVKTIVKQLKQDNFQSSSIHHCHRMGKPPSSGGKPRPILVKLRDMDVRNNIWFAKTHLKATGITLSEFLTKTRHELFIQARKKLGVSKCWTRDGTIYAISYDGSRHRLDCQEDLARRGVDLEPRRVPVPSSCPGAGPGQRLVPPQRWSEAPRPWECRERVDPYWGE
ncbi:hypothetical protein K1T71_014786 [Dendrolimus kikuchii]|nr:hypothetical protein K1T71_014786 [Dendrolimus kikuchii]